jgi:hypothetical protein
MTLRDSRDPAARVVLVLDNDFGDLAFAMYFLQGQPFAGHATLLLPPRLADRDDGRLPIRTRRFSSAQDILRVVDDEKPDAVFLLSGYMLAIHGLVGAKELSELIERLRARCCVVTSDPFLGLTSEGELGSRFGIHLPRRGVRARVVEFIWTRKLIRHLKTAREALEPLPHLYQLRPADGGERHGTTRPERISFYNPQLIGADGEGGVDGETSGPREWLFILGAEDIQLQAGLHGGPTFVDLVVAKLEETLEAGRTPVLIGSERLLEAVRNHAPSPRHERFRLLSFISYRSFEALMLSAEYVFYWNIISYSSLLRLVHGRPFFIFHTGHLVHNVKGLRERVRDWYYQGWEPVVLDQTTHLNPDQLDLLAADYREASSRIRTALARAPTPVEVMERLRAGCGKTDGER